MAILEKPKIWWYPTYLFCHFLSLFLCQIWCFDAKMSSFLGVPKLGGSKIWPKPLKMTYFGPLFGPLFTTLFVYVLFALQLHAYLGKTWKDAKKVVQKVGFGVSRTSRGLQKLDILTSKCQVLTHFLTIFWPIFWPKMGHFLAKKGVQKWVHLLDPFFGLFSCFTQICTQL